jgi:fructose/tagatose bisphosphate aldolase
MTDPLQAREFVERTRIDALAVAVGNVHGFTANPVTLDLERLNAIAAQCPVPLVLHGASGLPRGQLRGALSCGVAKVNINAELRRAYLAAVEHSLPQAMSNADAVAVWREGRAAVTVAALRIIDSLAPTCEPRSTTEHVTARAHSRQARP